MDSDQSGDGIMYADIPIRGIRVLYPVIGDLPGWLSVIAMLLLFVLTSLRLDPNLNLSQFDPK